MISATSIDFFFEDTGATYEEGYALAVPTNIKTLLAGNAVEWARIEFKETWDTEASLKTICAFANDIDNWGGVTSSLVSRKRTEGQSIP